LVECSIERFAPVAAIDQVVPVRDDVVHRAAVVAERNAAVHAARALGLGGLVAQGMDEFAVVFTRVATGSIDFGLTLELEESCHLAHYAASFIWPAAISLSARRYSLGNTLTNRFR
jgi:hypothetical protein